MNSPEAVPRLSVGMPVFNGDLHLAQAIESVLEQDLTDFELIISDNASTDRTQEICMAYAAKDSRVRYFRQPDNIGAPRNWNFVFQQARAPQFKWASASDFVAPGMFAKCCAELDRCGDAVLCAGHTCFVDDDGRELGVYDKDFAVLDDRPSDRFQRVHDDLMINNLQSGVIRRAALCRTRLDRLYPHGDLVLMAELALIGKFILLPETLLYRRSGAQHFTGMRQPEQIAGMFRPKGDGQFRLLRTRRHLDYVMTALLTQVPVKDRYRAAMCSLKRAYWELGTIGKEVREFFGLSA